MKFFGKIKQKKIVWTDKTKLINFIQSLDEDCEVAIEIEEIDEYRTTQQNKLYWSWIQIIADTLGYSKEECHEIIKYKFLLTQDGLDYESNPEFYLRSTSTLSRAEFSRLTTDIYFWAHDTLNITLPNE